MFTIQEVFYDRTGKAGPAVTGSISVLRNIPYLVGIEVVRTDTDNEHEHIDISIDGKNFGRCNPTGHNDCSWYNCSTMSPDNQIEIRSSNGRLDFRASFSPSVDSGGRFCSWNGIETYGIVRVTMTPKNGRDL